MISKKEFEAGLREYEPIRIAKHRRAMVTASWRRLDGVIVKIMNDPDGDEQTKEFMSALRDLYREQYQEAMDRHADDAFWFAPGAVR